MKKIITVFVLITAVMVFFSVSVFAVSYPDYTVGGAHTTYLSNGTNISVDVESLNPVMYGGDMYHIITVQIRNQNIDRNVYLSGAVPILISFSPNANTSETLIYDVKNIDNYGPDFSITTYNETAYLRLVPKAEYSYLSFICIPAETSLSAIAIIKTNTVSVASGGSSQNYYAYASAVSIKENEVNVTYTDHSPIGSSDNDLLDAVLDMQSYLISTIHQDNVTSNAWLGQIRDKTYDIYTRLGYTNDKLDTLHSDASTIHSDISTSNSWLSQIKAFVENINSNLAGSASTNSGINQGSSDLKSGSDSMHTQEQAFFNQNTQAINDTGLSNYRIGNTDAEGVASVSVDFTNIWNALSGWNVVYIFSLTLTVALTIIRHAPNAISRRMRRSKDNE